MGRSTIFQRIRDLIASGRRDVADGLINMRAEREEDFNARYFCTHCREETIEPYMVTDEVWKAAGMEKGFLHLACLEERIGRPLTPEDFPDYPINITVLFGFKR